MVTVFTQFKALVGVSADAHPALGQAVRDVPIRRSPATHATCLRSALGSFLICWEICLAISEIALDIQGFFNDYSQPIDAFPMPPVFRFFS